jgi:hypothetical protein
MTITAGVLLLRGLASPPMFFGNTPLSCIQLTPPSKRAIVASPAVVFLKT